MVRINGNKIPCEGIILSDYLAQMQYDVRRVAVEINGEIVPKSQYECTVFSDGDSVEIVSFVGGG